MKKKIKIMDKVTVKPLKDWHIIQNEYDIKLKEGEEIEIPTRFIETLLTENVIKKEVTHGFIN